MNPSKRTMYAILAGVGISLGVAGIASAASTGTTIRAAAIASAAADAVTIDTTATTPTDPSSTASTTDSSTASTTDPADDSGTTDDSDTTDEGGRHGDRTPSYTSSVTIAVAADGTKPTDAELQAVAAVTSDEAIAAALADTPGTPGEAELKSIAGNVVWEVDVTATAGGDYDVIVDAGNATVLDTHVEGHGGGGGHRGHHCDDADDADTSTATTDTDATATTTTG